MRPRQQPSPGVGLGLVAPGDGVVDLEPPVQPGIGGERHEGAVVDVPDGDHPARAAHPRHLPQRGDRVGQVLQDLMRMDDVERVVGRLERVHVADFERDRHGRAISRRPASGSAPLCRATA